MRSIWSGLVLQTLLEGEGREGRGGQLSHFLYEILKRESQLKEAEEREIGEEHVTHND